MDAVLYVLRTGIPWRDLPTRFGPSNSVFQRFNRWAKKKIWTSIFEAVQEPDWKWLMIDASVIRVISTPPGRPKKSRCDRFGARAPRGCSRDSGGPARRSDGLGTDLGGTGDGETLHVLRTGARHYVRVLQLLSCYTVDRLEQAIALALASGDPRVAAIERTAERLVLSVSRPPPSVAAFTVPTPDLTRFNQLLTPGDGNDRGHASAAQGELEAVEAADHAGQA